LDFFAPNMGAVSDGQGEGFQQYISTMERYAGQSSQNMLADYCWNFIEELSIASYKEMSYRKKLYA